MPLTTDTYRGMFDWPHMIILSNENITADQILSIYIVICTGKRSIFCLIIMFYSNHHIIIYRYTFVYTCITLFYPGLQSVTARPILYRISWLTRKSLNRKSKMSLADELLADLEDAGLDGEEVSMEHEQELNGEDDGIEDIEDIDDLDSGQKGLDTNRVTYVARWVVSFQMLV